MEKNKNKNENKPFKLTFENIYNLDIIIDFLTYELNIKLSENILLSKLILKDIILKNGFIYI